MRIFSSVLAWASVAVVLNGCTAKEQMAAAQTRLAEPDVIMEADPPPPFTYWAPVGSTIRNHPREAGIWIAEAGDRPVRYYFGDQCRASEFQRFVGQRLDALPEKPADAVWRTACTTCAVTSDLARSRMNIAFEDETRVVTSISCG